MSDAAINTAINTACTVPYAKVKSILTEAAKPNAGGGAFGGALKHKHTDGRSYAVHHGSRGGRYIVVNKRKIYI